MHAKLAQLLRRGEGEHRLATSTLTSFYIFYMRKGFSLFYHPRKYLLFDTVFEKVSFFTKGRVSDWL